MWSIKDERIQISSKWSCNGKYHGHARGNLHGRSLINMYQCARRAGVWPYSAGTVDTSHLGYLPKHEVLAVATGSQGEPRTALRRLAANTHPDFELEAGDRVIFSARAIPGNEESIEQLIHQLKSRGIEVITIDDTKQPIHASGHPAQEELKILYQWVQPQIAIPVHGELEHMKAHSELAKSVGVKKVLTGINGDVFLLSPVPGIQRNKIATGRLGFEKNELIRISE